ncbi:MAG: ABC transporter permease subunit [Armatimonadia bacterium]|nr:ABC transporter permease subunit [Armatimonadia bacterium]
MAVGTTKRQSRIKLPLAVLGFLAPNLLGFLGFTLLPVVLSFIMAFTNWNLKPAVDLEYVGMRNFQDLIGVQALDRPAPLVSTLYFVSAGILIAGVIGVLWANMAEWRGSKIGGVLITALGVAAIALAFLRPKAGDGGAEMVSHGLVISGGIAIICGLGLASKEGGQWRLGLGTVPGVLVIIGGLGLWLLGAPMWETYEPRDVRFWQYFYNTAYLMIGIPFGIAGSLALALLVNNDLPIGGRAPGPTLGIILRIAAVAICVIYGIVGGMAMTSYSGVMSGAGVAALCFMGGLLVAFRAPAERLSQITGALVCLACGIVTMLLIWGMGQANIALLGGLFWVMVAMGVGFNIVAYRTVYYLPTFTAGVALMILWKALYNPETGPINVAIETIGTALGQDWQGPEWLASVPWAKPALIIMGVWTGIGGTNMLLYLAGLSNVPGDLMDAADVDGASAWGKFRHVTWPQLAPTTFFITVMSIIGGLQGGFEQARVMTQGGPAGSTTTLSYYIYNKAFQDLDLGYAAAVSWVLFAVIFVATALNWKFGRELEVSP